MRWKGYVLRKWIPLLIIFLIIMCFANFIFITVLSDSKTKDNAEGTLEHLPHENVPKKNILKSHVTSTLRHGGKKMKKLDLDSISQMDYVPMNSRNISEVKLKRSDVKPDSGGNIIKTRSNNSKEEVPDTFNEEYIRYFWKHPELYKKYNETINALRNQRLLNDSQNKHTDNDIGNEVQARNGVVETRYRQQQTTFITVDSARGDLGSQMFQLASLIGIATIRNFIPILPMRNFKTSNVFKTKMRFLPDSELKTFQKFTDENKTVETVHSESKRLEGSRNWTIDGWFQSFQYFRHAEESLRQQFEFQDVYQTAAHQFIQDNIKPGQVKIGIHIRRQFSSEDIKLGLTAVTADYVRNAQDYFLTKFTNILFIVVSDNETWCRDNIHGDNVVYSAGQSTGTDLAILAECNHVIISVGPLSWWGGWLAGGTVIYYKHYPAQGSYLARQFNTQLYYPSNWIPME